MFSIAQLLVPISAERSCGDDISFSAEVDDIAHARQFDDPGLDQGAWVVALKEADWPFVAARCARLIESRSKDLRLAVWLAEAHAKTRHFRGLGDGYALLAGLCEHYWDGLHPEAEEGDYEQRIGNLFWLLSRSPALVRDIRLTEGTPYAWADFEAARQRAAGEGALASPQTTEPDAERRRNSAPFNAALLADAEYCLAMLGALEQVIDLRLGADGPGFSAARDALRGVIHFIAPQGPAGAGATIADSANTAPGETSGRATPAALDGPLRSRAQALAQLRLVADFFRNSEPHSPVAYLADKAAGWGEMPLHQWLRSVVKDPGAIAQLEELLGGPGGSTST